MKIVYALLLTAGICMSMGSCKLIEAKNAVAFNDSIIRMNQVIIADAKVWGDSLTKFAGSGDYARLVPIRTKMEQRIAGYISAVTAMKPVGKGGEQFKEQELLFLKTEKRVVNLGFSPYERLSATSTATEIQTAYTLLSEQVTIEQKEVTRLNRQQQQYAKDNNFKLQQKDLR